MPFICSIPDSTKADSGNTNYLSLLNQLSPSLWAKSPPDIGKIHSAPPFKIQVDPSRPLPRINQYPISKEALQSIKLLIKYYNAQGLIISCTSPCNTTL